jgi:hypothetical protein
MDGRFHIRKTEQKEKVVRNPVPADPDCKNGYVLGFCENRQQRILKRRHPLVQ